MAKPILLNVPDELVGERIVARPFRDEDAEPMFAAIDDSRAHIRRYLPWPDFHVDPGDTLEFIRRSRADWTLRNAFPMGVFLRDDGSFLGGVGLGPREWQVPSFEIGYWIRQSAEGRGYVTEAVKMVTRLAFETLGAKRVMIRCDPTNARSRAIPERLGFAYEGLLRNDFYDADGAAHDARMYSLIPDEYQEVCRAW